MRVFVVPPKVLGLQHFAQCERGSIAIIVTLMSSVLFAFGGVAADLLRAQSIRTELQVQADASVLAAAANMALDADSRKTHVKQQFEIRNQLIPEHLSVSATGNDEVVSLTVTGNMPTTLLRVLGITEMGIDIRSSAAVAQPRSGEIALVLDYSGSMQSQSKYQTMSSAASDLVTKLMGPDVAQAARDRVKIGLVPFSEYVYADVRTEHIRGVHSNHFGRTVRACLDGRRYPYAVKDTTPNSGIDNSRWAAPGMPQEYYEAGTLSSDINGSISYGNCNAQGMKEITTTSTQRVCSDWDDGECEGWRDETVTTTEYVPSDECDRNHSPDEMADQDAEAVTSDFASNTPQCAAYRDRNLLVRPLTSDYQQLLDQLSIMRPLKLTDISFGLQMGWHVLSPNQPFVQGVDYDDEEVEKTIVLLTDGAQTVGGFGPSNNFSVSQANDNTRESCDRIKAKGVRIITVAFDLDDQAAKAMLQACATDPSNDFFDATNADGLVDAFAEITAGFQAPARLVN